MPQADAYKEEISSQIPAVQLLIKLGWRYLRRPRRWPGARVGKRRTKGSISSCWSTRAIAASMAR
ncbi:MAG: hypothetical protein KatS3mg057_0728 [Herpetosiphonaceae bacterium]|nr:MAG: hypothetical protein KatS3mg057_0728 [Herpetosiphonaceae bacterium]